MLFSFVRRYSSKRDRTVGLHSRTAPHFWEPLEVRRMLSGTQSATEVGDFGASSVPRATPTIIATAATVAPQDDSVSGYTPAELKNAYGINQIRFRNKKAVNIAGNGAGQTIAIVDPYRNPDILSDLAAFDSEFSLPAPPSFKQVSETGTSTLPAVSTEWGLEIAIDVEWAHAIAPQANILLIEANTSRITSLLKGVSYARSAKGVSVVSMSWVDSEFAAQKPFDANFTTPKGHVGVTFVAATGDQAAAGGANWPAASTNVIGVGGTTLTLNGGSYVSETAWSGTSGGISRYESKPTYQSAIAAKRRSSPDVAYSADPAPGLAVYDTYVRIGWTTSGGTSTGTPQFAALIAIADQGRALKGAGSLDGPTQTLPALYEIYANPTTYAADFNDITEGSNGDSATSGYDVVTGLGSPKAAALVQSLASADLPKGAKAAAGK